MTQTNPPELSEQQKLREAYLRSGRLPLGTLFRLGMKGLFFEPAWLPLKYLSGAVGMKLRQLLYRRWLGHMGRGSLIDIGVEIPYPKNIYIGIFSLIDRYVQLTSPEGSITIGNYCHVAPFTLILGSGTVVVEDYVGIAAGSRVFSISEWPIEGKRVCGPMVPLEQRGLRSAPVRIERDVLVGANCVVMPGVTIGRGAVIGSNSVVTRSIEPWTIAAGLPARPIGKRDPVTVEDLPTE